MRYGDKVISNSEGADLIVSALGKQKAGLSSSIGATVVGGTMAGIASEQTKTLKFEWMESDVPSTTSWTNLLLFGHQTASNKAVWLRGRSTLELELHLAYVHDVLGEMQVILETINWIPNVRRSIELHDDGSYSVDGIRKYISGWVQWGRATSSSPRNHLVFGGIDAGTKAVTRYGFSWEGRNGERIEIPFSEGSGETANVMWTADGINWANHPIVFSGATWEDDYNGYNQKYGVREIEYEMTVNGIVGGAMGYSDRVGFESLSGGMKSTEFFNNDVISELRHNGSNSFIFALALDTATSYNQLYLKFPDHGIELNMTGYNNDPALCRWVDASVGASAIKDMFEANVGDKLRFTIGLSGYDENISIPCLPDRTYKTADDKSATNVDEIRGIGNNLLRNEKYTEV